jgi:hypothetical protein
MTRSATEAWLADLQQRFGELLRTPLDASSGTLRAQTERYDSPLVAAIQSGARERLAVYNRQYWFRLLTVMQTSWPLSARLLGMFHFNLHAQRFLLQHPPAHYDLGFVTLGFAAYLAANVGEQIGLGPRYAPLPRAVLLEAATLDAAFAHVFNAPAQPRFDPRQHAPRELVQRRLVSSAAYARVTEHWPLAELRLALRDRSDEQAAPVPPPLSAARHWALFRNAEGVAQLELAPLQARLFELLDSHPLGEALAQLEAEADIEAREHLPARTQAWIAQGVANHFWIGLAD